MNKNLYRIVFNKARGMLMVVAEIARSGRASSARSSGVGHTHSRLIGKVGALSFSLWLATGVIQPVHANVVADGSAPANQQPTIINSANGTPQVNIQTPSAAGVSHNKYGQFDVNQQGVILNNSHKNVQTQLGGMVAGNPWLGKGEARVILNEVNSRDPSRLNGYVEVAGKKAQVVIANPAGITCDGCGFINANRGTLTTGQPQMNNGQLTGYSVERGEISIDGKGLDSSRADYTDIIARSVKVNAGVWANELNVTTGRNQVDAEHQQISKTSDDPATRPQMALDVASLGGMYAGKIRMVGTESGVGVRNAGNIGAQAGSVTITADGRIENSGNISASGDTQIAATGGIDNHGAVYAGNNASVQSGGELNNRGSVVARNNTRVQAASLTGTKQGVLAAGVQDDGKLAAQGDLDLSTSGQLSAHGQTLAGGNLSARGQGVDLSGSQTQADNLTLDAGNGDLNTSGALVSSRQLTARSGKLLNNDGGTINADTMSVQANALSNQKGSLVQTGNGDLSLDLPGELNNREGQIAANGNVALRAQSLNNRQGQVIAAQNGSLNTEIRDGLDNTGGSLAASGDVHVNAGALNNDDGLISASAGKSDLTSHGAASNRKGRLESAGSLTLNAASLDNTAGEVVASGTTLQLNGGALTNTSGTLFSQGDLRLDSGALDNTSGLIQAAGNSWLDTHGAVLTNRNSGTTGGISSGGTLNLAAGDIDNQQGVIVSGGALDLRGDKVDNSHGQLGSEQALTAHADTLLNVDGSLKSGGDMALSAAALLDNTRGVTGAGRALDLDTATLTNQNGVLVSGDRAGIDVQSLDNRAGQIAAQQALTLGGETINNDDGGLIQSGAALSLTAGTLSNSDSGDKGGITSLGDMTLTADSVANNDGVLLSAKAITLNSGTLDNTAGELVATDALNLALDGTLTNTTGLMQGGSVTLDTAGHAFTNNDGTLNSLGALTLSSGALNNQNGTLAAKGAFDLSTASLDNRSGGRIIGEQDTTLTSGSLQNGGGQIQSVGDLLLDTAKGAIDNVSGLIRSGADLTVIAASFANQNTQGSNQGVEANTATFTTGTLNNQRGTILANDKLAITNGGLLDNTGGALASSGTLTLNGAALDLLNTGGVAKAGELLDISAQRVSGDGDLLSLGDMILRSNSALDNSGSIIANDSLQLTTPGSISNSGKLLAGKKLDLHGGSLSNAESGEINAGENRLTISGTLTNYGLIDGGYTRIDANTLNNVGTGRIYGDAIGINTVTFNNLAAGGKAATLAGRERVDIGTDTLNNYDHALVYSGGDMAIGGQLDDKGNVAGRAGIINNHSSTIESANNMWIAAGQINNINDHFSTELVTVSQEQIREYQHSGSPTRWDATTEGVFVDGNSADRLRNLNTPDDTGANNDNFNQYDYNRTVEETRIKETDPAKIIAGGDMTIVADELFNDKSQVIAGGTLFTDGIKLTRNEAVDGERHTTDVGTVTHYYRIRHKGSDEQGRDRTAYQPPTVIQTISLKPGQIISKGTVEGSNVTIAPLTTQGTDVAIAKSGSVTGKVDASTHAPWQQTVSDGEPVTPPPGQQFAVTPGEETIRIVGPNTQLPDNSLFKINPSASESYLVETDPRFTNEKEWLGSDYMQDALGQDQDNKLKRLGDGYYEQRLIREQVVDLTGQRYLEGYTSDEEQYKALMDAGVAFGKQYALKLGVALTPQQMSLLTGDIVWLVNTQVKMPDGSMQSVLMPQVYAKVKPGDISGSGALIAGNNVVMKLDGDLFNRGTIAGRRVLQLDADNITNQAGTIQGASASLTARTDVNNIGGVLQGTDSLLVNAGRDINATTTTRSAESAVDQNRFSRTTIDSVSGIYVQGDDGKLSLKAGRDVNLTGAQVINSGENGQTQIGAARDINLGTVTTSARDSLVWDKDNTLNQGRIDRVGTQIKTRNDTALAAGQNINVDGSSIASEKALNLNAGNDVNIRGVLNSTDLDERHKVTGSSGWLSKKTTTTRDTVDRQTVQGSELSADSVKVIAGNNIGVIGSSIAGTGDVAMKAGNDLTISSMAGRNDETHLKQEKKSGLMGSGGIGFTIGSRKESTDQASQAQSGESSLVGSLQGDTVLVAGNNYRQTGSTVSSPNGNVVIEGKNVTIEAAQDTYASQFKHSVEQKGFTLAVNVPVIQALEAAAASVKRVGESNDDRINMLAAANAGWDSARAANAMMDSAQGVMQNGAQGAAQNVSVSLTYGQSKQSSTQDTTSTSALASKVNAGKNAVVVAHGGERSDINIIGSDVSGKQGTLLQADNDVNILAAQQERHERSDNKSSGWNAGVAVSYGQGGASFGITAGANKGKGYGNGDEVSWRNSHVGDMDSQTQIVSGGDTTLRGGQVLGKGVDIVADNLNIESLQDTMKYQGKQTDMGGQVTVGYGFAASGNFSKSKVDADYASVAEQSGIFAGDDGYQIDINDLTNLKGGLITSNESAEQAGKNRFSTGTLTWSDIDNHSEYEGTGIGLGGSMSMNADLGLGDNAAPQSSKTVTDKNGNTQLATGYGSLQKDVSFGIGHDSDSQQSVTRSGINTSAITITDADAQQRLTGKTVDETLAEIKTDITTENAAANAGYIENNFDKDKVFKELNLQVKVTKDFKQNANKQISSYLDGKQAAARDVLKKAIASGDREKQQEAVNDIYKLQYQRRFLQTLVGVVAGSPDTAITQGTLSLAATKMREETIQNSLIFEGVKDRTTGKVYSNVSGDSTALYDGVKAGGTRIGLDIICGKDNGRCETVDKAGLILKRDTEGHVIYKGNDDYKTMDEFLQSSLAKDLYGATGGSQALGGILKPFGTYTPGGFWGDIGDNIVESFAGAHDLIGGQLPGFYDQEGNTARGRSPLTNAAAETWTIAAIPIAAPFAASELISPELLEFIFNAQP